MILNRLEQGCFGLGRFTGSASRSGVDAHERNRSGMFVHPRKFIIPPQQRCPKRLGRSDVRCVVGRQRNTQPPHPMHADGAGAGNILAFQTPGSDRGGVKATPVLRSHAWDKHSSAMRTNRRCTERPLAA
jgi:hypothetical protein